MNPTSSVLSRLALVAVVAAMLGVAPAANAQTYQFKTFAKGLQPFNVTDPEAPEDPDSPWANVGVSATSLNFGLTAVGTPVTRTISVFNNDGQGRPVRIDAISTNDAEFVASHDCPMAPATLAANSSCTVSVDYLATMAASRSNLLTVATAANTRSVTLSGVAGTGQLEEIGHMSGNYGELLEHETLSRFLAVKNAGPSPITIDSADLLGSDVFTKTFDDCTGVTLAAGGAASCSVHVEVANVTEGEHTGSLQLMVDGNASITKALTVKGIVPFSVGAMSPAEVDSGDTDHVIEIAGNRFDGATFAVAGEAVAAEIDEDGKRAVITVPAVRFGQSQVVVTRAGESFSPTPARITGMVTLSIDSGSASGGDEIVISGNGFDANTRVFFAGIEAIIANVTNETLTVITPAGPAGESVTVRLQQAPGNFHSDRDIEMPQAFEYDDEAAGEGEVRTIQTDMVYNSAPSHLAYNPAANSILWKTNSGFLQSTPVGGQSTQALMVTATGGRDSIAVSPFAPVGYFFVASQKLRWFDLNTPNHPDNQALTINQATFPVILGKNDSVSQGALSQDGGTLVMYLSRSSNTNGNSLLSVPVDINGAPIPEAASLAADPQAPAGGYNAQPSFMTTGPGGSVWMLYNGAAGSRAPLIRRYNSAAMDGRVDVALPLAGESAYPLAASLGPTPNSFVVDNQGYAYIALQRGVYRFDLSTQTGSMYVGDPNVGGVIDGVGSEARFTNIVALVYSSGRLLVLDRTIHDTLREILR